MYAASNATIVVTVSKISTVISVDDNVDMKVGDSVSVNATLVPAVAGELDYVSSDVSVVSVNGIGELVAVGVGTANITIKYAGNEMYAASNATITVTVSKIATKISASAVSTVYNVNKNLIVTLKDANGKAMSGVNVTVNLNGAKNTLPTRTVRSRYQLKVLFLKPTLPK